MDQVLHREMRLKGNPKEAHGLILKRIIIQIKMNYCSFYYILKLFRFDWQGKHIKTISDNITAVLVINKNGYIQKSGIKHKMGQIWGFVNNIISGLQHHKIQKNFQTYFESRCEYKDPKRILNPRIFNGAQRLRRLNSDRLFRI